MTPRATPLPPDQRKDAIIDAVLPVLREHGRSSTTKQLAAAAGIAEGTIFRVFPSKDELFDAAVDHCLDPTDFLRHLDEVPRDVTLEARLLRMTELMQQRFVEVFELMIALALPGQRGPRVKGGVKGGPDGRRGPDGMEDWRERSAAVMTDVIGADAERLRVPVGEALRVLRVLTFSSSHPHLSEGGRMTPEQIVDIVLHGVLKETD